MPSFHARLAGTLTCLALALSAASASAQAPPVTDDASDSGPKPPPPRPRAPPPDPFGVRGQWVVTGASAIGFSSTTYDGSRARFFSASLSPGLDLFVSNNVAIGIDLDAEYAYSQGYGADGSLVGTRTTRLSGGPRVGYNVRLRPRLSFFPMVTVGFEWTHQEETLVSGQSLSVASSPVGYPSTTQVGPWVEVYLPLLWHVASHAFVGIGPWMYHDFGAVQGGPNVGGQTTVVGAGVVVGGWWGGPPAPQAVPASEAGSNGEKASPPAPRRFGEAGEVVIASDFVTSVDYTTYAGTGSSAMTLAFVPGVDVFVLPHVAAGLAIQYSESSGTSLDATVQAGSISPAPTVTFSDQILAVEPRVAFDIPLGTMFSVYLRAWLAVGKDTYTENSIEGDTSGSENFVSVGAFAPILVHPAPHFFVGFGPSVSRDLSRTIEGNGASNPSTSLGAGLVVGAWL